jgi:Fur family transcriptional regulator, ferric uptake regulator
MRNTRARRLVTEILQTCPTPLTLRELHARVREQSPRTAHSTVFRLVTRLEEERKVVRVDWRERGSRFEWAERPHHHHIVCDDCGKIEAFADQRLERVLRDVEQNSGYAVAGHDIVLRGACRTCR